MRHFIYLLTFCLALLAPQFATAGSTPAKPQTEKPSRVQQWLLKKALKKQQRIQQNPKKKARWERRVERQKEKDPRPMHWAVKVGVGVLFALRVLTFFSLTPIMVTILGALLLTLIPLGIIGTIKSGKYKLYKYKGLAVLMLIFPLVLPLLFYVLLTLSFVA